MKKIILSFILCISMLFSVTAFADNSDITITINGKTLETPIAPKIVNDRTMLPMRSIFEALGAKVTWFGEDKMIFATKGNTFITLKIGVPQMSVQTTESEENVSVSLDTAPFIDSDYTLVPARAVAESLQAKVDWLGETKTVVITTEK